jgi:fructose-1,6-bisphosphatase/inositol monophosphatase family enzyme
VSVITRGNSPLKLGQVQASLENHPNICHHGGDNISITGGLIASGWMHGSIFGGSSAVETAAMQLIVTEAGGIASDFSGNPLQGYELKPDLSGKLDFYLPHGAIMASDMALAEQLAQIVQQAQ